MPESQLQRQFPHIQMKNPSVVQEKLIRLIEAGLDKLHVISDFDFTITRSNDNGTPCWSSYGAVDTALSGTDLGAELDAMTKKYQPMEFSHILTLEEKIPLMVQWWQEAHEVIVKAKVTRKQLEDAVAHANIKLRDRAKEFIGQLESANVPLIVFSAGIAAVIQIFFQQQLGVIPQNVHIISNLIEFDPQTDLIVRFKDPVIHTFNKNSTVLPLEQPQFFERLVDRPMVILLGDTVGDTKMDVGLISESESLKLGFLNKNFDTLLPSYLEAYDIVIPNDQSMDVANWILQQIQKG